MPDACERWGDRLGMLGRPRPAQTVGGSAGMKRIARLGRDERRWYHDERWGT